ncbi:TolB family protein [Methanosarcina horonobensis]|uniref:TolB family protein n=1 Tax=Methanosarcina horonobensis TaxID=418008 RepID=UPI000B1C4887|nr:TolB family protein [Methanosarcina horonobensis]
MRKILKDLCLLMFIVILILPVEAVPGELSEFGNFTGGSGLNKTENASRNYFDSDSGLICIDAGKTVEYGEIISSDDLVEEITFLTDSPESELFPVWTADGEYILYTIERNQSDNLESYRIKADGSEIKRIGTGEGNLTGFSDLSLDGRDLVIIKSIDSQLDLYLASLENGTVIPVTSDPQISEGWGAWCRLGKKITYTQEPAGMPSQLWIVDRDGSNKTRLGTSENVGIGKDWCPLGLRVIYSAKDLKQADDLWVIDFYGTNQTQLTNTSYNEWNPSFSPDGKWIAYVSDEGGSPDIWLRDIEGNYRARITNNIGRIDSIPRWSPDGSEIVFAGHKPGNDSSIDLINSSDTVLISDLDASLINDLDFDPLNGSDIDQTNSSDIDPTGSSDNGSINVLNTATNNDSEIVIIKLLSAPHISPYPKITGVEVNPPEELLQEGNVTVSITVTNEEETRVREISQFPSQVKRKLKE